MRQIRVHLREGCAPLSPAVLVLYAPSTRPPVLVRCAPHNSSACNRRRGHSRSVRKHRYTCILVLEKNVINFVFVSNIMFVYFVFQPGQIDENQRLNVKARLGIKKRLPAGGDQDNQDVTPPKISRVEPLQSPPTSQPIQVSCTLSFNFFTVFTDQWGTHSSSPLCGAHRQPGYSSNYLL